MEWEQHFPLDFWQAACPAAMAVLWVWCYEERTDAYFVASVQVTPPGDMNRICLLVDIYQEPIVHEALCSGAAEMQWVQFNGCPQEVTTQKEGS
jgi:hypothetical protein